MENASLKLKVMEFWDREPCGSNWIRSMQANLERFDAYRLKAFPYLHPFLQFERLVRRRVLEVGCGLGSEVAVAKTAGVEIAAVDLSTESLRAVESRGLSIDLVQGDVESLPFRSGAFSQVYSIGVLHHTPNTEKAIDEVKRVVATPGRIVLMLYYSRSLRARLMPLVSRATGQTVQKPIDLYDGEDNLLAKLYGKDDVKRLFEGWDLAFQLREFWPGDISAPFPQPVRGFLSSIMRGLPLLRRGLSRVLGQYLYIFATRVST